MPTFLLFRQGAKLDEVVGANLGAVEAKIKQYASAASTSAQSPGYVLGSGRPATSQGSANAVITDQQMFQFLLVILGVWVAYAWMS